jgi:hypothetical protein
MLSKSKLSSERAISLNAFNQPEKNTLHVQQITNDLTQNVLKWWKGQKAQGKEPDDNDINQFVLNQLPETIGKYFQYEKDTREWIPRPLSRNPELTPDRINSALGGYVFLMLLDLTHAPFNCETLTRVRLVNLPHKKLLKVLDN